MMQEQIERAGTAAFLALAYGVAALVMQVFTASNTMPASDDDIRRLARKLAPFMDEQLLAAVVDNVRKAGEQVVRLEQKTSSSH